MTLNTSTCHALWLFLATIPATVEADSHAGVPGLATRVDRNLEVIEAVQENLGEAHATVEDIRQELGGASTTLDGTKASVDALVDQGKLHGTLLEALPERVAEAVRPRVNPAWPVWIGVRVEYRKVVGDGDRPSPLIIDGTVITYLNPGPVPASVGCTFFSSNGNLQIDRGGTEVVAPGAKGACAPNRDLPAVEPDFFSGWVLLTSDRPILPQGFTDKDGTFDREASIDLYPIDCRDPVGVEFVCDFVTQ